MFGFLVAILNFRFLMHESTDISKTILFKDFILAARYTKSILRSFTVALNFILTLTFTAKGHINIFFSMLYSFKISVSKSIQYQSARCIEKFNKNSAPDECAR